MRRCVVTRAQGERARMVRFVVGPGDVVVPDLAARLPGRGIWLSASGDVLETARRKGAFSRAARREVKVPADLPTVLLGGLRQRIADHLGLARRAGQAVAGFDKTKAMLRSAHCGLVVEASDGSPDERARLLSGVHDVDVATPLAARVLGPVFGRDHVVHVAIARGRLAELLMLDCGRLAGLVQRAPAPAAEGLRRTDR